MIKLNVWVTLGNAQKIPAGHLVVANPDGQGRLPGQFRYSADYLDHPQAFALDPYIFHLLLRISMQRDHIQECMGSLRTVCPMTGVAEFSPGAIN